MALLNKGDKIKLTGKTGAAIVEEFLAEGMQGEIYKVKYQGKYYALKYYKNVVNMATMRTIIQNNLEQGSPDKNFLWPLYITEMDHEKKTFGYLMELYDSTKFKPLKRFRYSGRTGVCFTNFDTLYTAAYNICKSFRKLHLSGYAYLDVSDSNIVADPKTGDILICDCDNCIPSITNLNPGIKGTPGFMAPEVLMGKNRPNRTSDYFSLAVLLFELFYVDHPLEGKATLSRPLTDELGAKMFGEYATFVMKPGKNPNGPVPGKTDVVLERWNGNLYPLDAKALFLHAFTTGLDARKRVSETEWIKMLVRMRGQTLVKGTQTRFFNVYKPEQLPANVYTAQCGNLRFILADGSKVYQPQLEEGMTEIVAETKEKDSFHKVVGTVFESPKNKHLLGLRNDQEGTIWYVTVPGRKQETVSYGEAIRISHGMKIMIHGKEVEVF